MAENRVTFGSDTGLNSFRFVLEAAENNGKTIFAPGERVRLKLYPGGRSPELSPSCGSAKIFSSGLKQTVTEFLAFRDSDSASVTYYIDRLISAAWEGTGTGRPKIYGAKLVMPEKTTGVFKIKYETSYDIADITCPRATYVLLTARTGELAGDTLIDFTDGYLSDIFEREVVMTVRDACTRETLPDAHVYVNEKYQGRTDSEGIIRLGSLKPSTYGLRITKDGYQATDEDTISNDFFTVE